MQVLIDDLLTYSRVGRNPKPFGPIDAAAAASDAQENLRKAVKERNAQVTLGPMPLVQGDHTAILQLFQNLLDNAIKFSTGPPRIHISAQRQDEVWVFSVQDSGIGIEPEHSESIFEVFNRLYTYDEYPGSGVGLAICNRIVELHGGQIWWNRSRARGRRFDSPFRQAFRSRRNGTSSWLPRPVETGSTVAADPLHPQPASGFPIGALW